MSKADYGTRKKYHFIYKTTNVLTGRYYIGMHSTNNLNDGYLGSGIRLKYSLNKYGKENHIIEILEFFESRKELLKREEEIVTLDEIAKKECMNLKTGGIGGCITSEGKKRLSEILKERWTHPEFRNKIIKNLSPYNFAGKKHTEESKRKMSESSKGMRIGEKNSQYGSH